MGMNISIIKLGAIGDVIRTTAILHGLKVKYKNCIIDWVTKKECFDILKNNSLINYIYLIDKDENKLKCKNYDLVISLDDDYEACRLASEVNSIGVKVIPKKGCVCCYKSKCDVPPEWDINEFVRAIKSLL